jgi:hypothetical protein
LSSNRSWTDGSPRSATRVEEGLGAFDVVQCAAGLSVMADDRRSAEPAHGHLRQVQQLGERFPVRVLGLPVDDADDHGPDGMPAGMPGMITAGNVLPLMCGRA